ncbi:PAS domain S-box-containing protein/diguanylate cyclase (GGDEF)-like protein [Rubrivivax gelatinosus]|uniref:PAS domain S-box-containing protein/diguanylate cyclase (GGDEF)-like protein n=1 Tax=Rubrivivax gelatinosus TaxID=28068 RepID=A0A4V2SHD3_RUBGE|nr:PAS domain S-box-containing protein/diguanylate cyclase (GGDEF)-like protein [Rubrivivax gelatinosus]
MRDSAEHPVSTDGQTALSRRPGPLARWLPTLKARLAVGSTLMLFAAIALTLTQMVRVAEQSIEASVERQQQVEVQRSADVVSRRVRTAQRALSATAPLLTKALLADERRLHDFFQAQAAFRSSFGGIVVADARGRALIAMKHDGVVGPQPSLGAKPTFRRVLQTRLPEISSPTVGLLSAQPVVVFAQPLIAGDGEVYGVLFGSVPLDTGGLAADLDTTTDGAEDGDEFTVITAADGRIVSHPDHGRVLQPVASEPRLSAAYARWVRAGRPHSAQAGAWSGADEVVAMAGEPETGWQVWRVVPRRLLKEPLREARIEALELGAAFSLVMSALMVWFLARQLRPLDRLQRRAARLLAGDERAGWPDADGEIGRLAQTLRQVVAERMRAEQARAVVLRRLGSVLAASPVGLAFERDGRLELVSAEVCRLLGRDETQLVGRDTALIFASAVDDETMRRESAEAFARGEVYEGEWRLVGREGPAFWSRLRARPVDAADPSAGTIWCMYDISGQVDARERLEHAARHDPLTGLLNRDGFAIALQQVLQARAAAGSEPRPATLVMIDLDRFKPINDAAGHAAGDAMLQRVAAAIADSVRSSDAAARIGGDEFALLLPHCDVRQGLAVAGKVEQAIAAIALDWDGQALRLGASLGLAELGPAARSAEQWLAAADAACYEAKRRGGGVVVA